MPDPGEKPPNKGAKEQEITKEIIEVFGMEIFSNNTDAKLGKLFRFTVKKIAELQTRIENLEQ